MKLEFEQRLMDDFPFMEARNVWTGKKLGFPSNCECNDGWFGIIYKLCLNIQSVLNYQSKKFIDGFYIIQIKEKFGGLRFYTTYTNNDINKLIDDATKKSLETCENCGAEGKVRNGSWILTLCDNCYKKSKKESK